MFRTGAALPGDFGDALAAPFKLCFRSPGPFRALSMTLRAVPNVALFPPAFARWGPFESLCAGRRGCLAYEQIP
ncbi:hypothetical protein AWB91_27300 [Mycobacterium paraense]|jgi:hypothetical protein|uniref:Uncharacterized protein n=1 Tax=Mycobacterium paraense TaxID=767916 RepID=A0ABX3VGQ6_9MYCO|nr:hypothetical protein AWB91_27300 [Mycobacterium paraense]ORW39359.1 hypothetical protein AWB88_16295 [Mycobacterium paraense]